MNASKSLARQLEEVYSGDPWHGDALRPLLSGLKSAVAAHKPIGQAHSIWELVAHLTTWKDVVRERIEGKLAGSVPTARDWPAVTVKSQAAWESAVQKLDRAHQRLLRVVEHLPETYLGRAVVGSGSTYGETLRGAVLHDTYHAGQIAILAKAGRADGAF